MSVGERIYDLGAEPVKGTAKGIVGGFKNGAIVFGAAAALLSGWGVLALGASVGLAVTAAIVAGGVGFAGGGALGGVSGGAIGGVGGTLSGVKKFLVGRQSDPDSREAQMEMLRRQAYNEDMQTAAFQRQQQRAAAMNGVNPDAATDNAAKLAQQAQAAPQLSDVQGRG